MATSKVLIKNVRGPNIFNNNHVYC